MANKAEILITGRDTSNTAFKSANKGMKGLILSATKVSSAIGAIGGGIALASLGVFTRRVIDAQDELAKMSQKLGISVEGLAGLQHAGDLAGISLEQIQKGVKSLSSQLFDAASGLLESKRNFTALNVEIKNTDGTLRRSEDIIVELADKFKDMENGTEKTALAVKLFGKAGLDLIPLLNEGSAALARMVAEGKELNPVTAESARQSEVFNDNILRLEKSLKQTGIEIVNRMIPSLSRLSEIFTDATLNTGNFWQVVRGGLINLTDFSEDADSTSIALRRIRKEIREIDVELKESQQSPISSLLSGRVARLLLSKKLIEEQKAFLERSNASEQKEIFVNDNLTGGESTFRANIEDSTATNKAASEAKTRLARQKAFVAAEEKKAAVLGKSAEAIALLTARELGLNEADTERVRIAGESARLFKEDAAFSRQFQKDLEKKLTAKNAFIKAEEKEREQSGDRFSRNALELSLLGETENKRNLILAQFDNEIIKREKIIALGKLDLDGVTRKQLEGELELAEIRSNNLAQQEQLLESQRETSEELTEFGIQAARNLQTAFADFLFDPFDKGLKGMAIGFSSILRRMVAEASSKQLLQALFGAKKGDSGLFGDLIKGIGTILSGSGGPTGGFNSLTSGTGPTQIPLGFAEGGRFIGGYRFVGERGPELEATGPSRIYSASQTRDLLRGGQPGDGVNITLNVSTGVAQTVRVEMANLLPDIVKQATEAIVAAKNRQTRLGSQL